MQFDSRWRLNYDHAWFAQEIIRGGVRLDQEDVFTTRVRFDF
ncbi:MAG: hypothetical protein ACOZHQ_17075 [Thermodesulfobacteriota bacterium]